MKIRILANKVFMTLFFLLFPVIASAKETSEISYPDTAWILISSALVMLMLPGLALFYGGMVRRKNVLSTFMHSFIPLGEAATSTLPDYKTIIHQSIKLYKNG